MIRGFYKHERCLDAYIFAHKTQFYGEKYQKLKVEWFVRGRSLNIRETITVKNEDLKKWIPCDCNGLLDLTSEITSSI